MDAGSKFTEGSLSAILLAQQEAVALGGSEVDNLHLLLGVCAGETVAAQALNESITREKMRSALANLPGRKTKAHPEPRLSRAAKGTLKRAYQEAVDLRHNYVGPEHLLLALLHQVRDPAVRVLRHAVDAAALRVRVLQLLGCDASLLDAARKARREVHIPLLNGGTQVVSSRLLNAVCFMLPILICLPWLSPTRFERIFSEAPLPLFGVSLGRFLLVSSAQTLFFGFFVAGGALRSSSPRVRSGGAWSLLGIIVVCLVWSFVSLS